MLTVIQNFKDNIEEVEEYFHFLEKIENGHSLLNNNAGETFTIDSDLSRMLKANAFLIVYNLIEATIKSGLWEMFETIKADQVSYDKLIKEIQLLWIDHRIKLEYRTQDETVNTKILNIINQVLGQSLEYYQFKHQLKFDAGTLDINGINQTFKRHGLSNLPAHNLITESFRTIKKNRNYLAHGDMTFKECGKDYSFRDLRIIKCHIIRHLFKSLFSIKLFIEQKTYEKPILA